MDKKMKAMGGVGWGEKGGGPIAAMEGEGKE